MKNGKWKVENRASRRVQGEPERTKPFPFSVLHCSLSQGRGLTLIELVVVLTVLACAAGLIVPRIGGSLSRQELQESGQRLAWTARTIRESAVARGQKLVLMIDLDEGAYAAARRATGGSLEPLRTSWIKPTRWPETVKVTEMKLPDGTTATSGQQQIGFEPDGTSSGGSIRLISGDREYVVLIRPGSGSAVAGDPREIAMTQDQYDLGD